MLSDWSVTTHCKRPGRRPSSAPIAGRAVATARLSNRTRNGAAARTMAAGQGRTRTSCLSVRVSAPIILPRPTNHEMQLVLR